MLNENKVICLTPEYSTTRRVVSGTPPDEEIGLSGHVGILSRADGGLRRQGYRKTENSESGPLVTVVTAVFNGEKTLEQTILSVISQSYDNLEFIVIDGGSRDGTLDIIKKYEHAIDYWVSEPDGGIYDAWNKGVRLSSGTWIAFLGSDDIYLDGAVQAYIDFIKNQKDVAIDYVSSKINLTDGSRVLRTVGLPWSWNIFRKYMKIAHVGSLHHKKLFKKYGLFDDSYKITGDYEFLLRSGPHLRAYFYDRVTVNMHVGGVSNANSLVFEESEKAKVTTGKRDIFMCQIEKYYAILKWKLRSYL